LVARQQAHVALGLPQSAGFVYLCLASMHSEQELVFLCETFLEAEKPAAGAQLLLAGTPYDKRTPDRLLQRAANTGGTHIFLERYEDNLPLYMGAAHAIVIPHFAQPSAGMLEIALLALSYERVVVAPDLPRFHGMLPQPAAVFYEPGNSSSLTQALLTARNCRYALSEKGLASLDARSGWEQYAQRLLDIYQRVLRH